jgi:RNA polymerase sigma-70 factor (ECF subfamily)
MTALSSVPHSHSEDEAHDLKSATARDRAEELRLVECAADRDATAFAQLYDQHVVRVYRHIYYVVNDRNAAEDLTAQTFLKAWEAIDRYKDRGAPFLAWLLRIAHNQSISYLRANRNHSELEDTHIDQNRGGNPEASLEQGEDQKAIHEAITQLREEQRQVIMLRFVEELDYESVARMIGKSVPAVRVIQHRALGSLRKMMKA